MYKATYPIRLTPKQPLLFIPLGDIHYDTEECDRERFHRLMTWIGEQEQRGAVVRLLGVGDYLDCLSPSERGKTAGAGYHRTTMATMDAHVQTVVREFLAATQSLVGRMIGVLSGHHYWRYGGAKMGVWQGRTSDEQIAHGWKAPYVGDGAAFIRLTFPPTPCFLDVFGLHGGGSAQTPGGRVMKRIRFAEIAPTAHLVVSGHDNAKLAYPRSGLDFDHGGIKRYVIGSGSFQRAYIDGTTEASYAEQIGLVPADLGITIVRIEIERRAGQWRVDYHASV